MNGGELAALYSFIFLYLAARGGGPFGLDGLIRARRGKKPAAPVEPRPPAETPVGDEPMDDDFPELTEEDLAPDPEVAELLGDDPKS
jgi:hypothetical protein